MVQATVDTNTRRRDFLALTAAVATTVLAARPAPAAAAVDPVFDLIARHAEIDRTIDAMVAAGQTDDWDKFSDNCSVEMELFLQLMETVPTTLAGVVGLVMHLETIRQKEPWKFEDNYATPLIGTLAQAFQSIGGKL